MSSKGIILYESKTVTAVSDGDTKVILHCLASNKSIKIPFHYNSDVSIKENQLNFLSEFVDMLGYAQSCEMNPLYADLKMYDAWESFASLRTYKMMGHYEFVSTLLFEVVSYGFCEPNFKINGEPCFPLGKLTKHDVNADSFKLAMLDRLRQNCLYYLGKGNKNKEILWDSDEKRQINAIKKLWNALPKAQRPVWLTMTDIEAYEKEMIV